MKNLLLASILLMACAGTTAAQKVFSVQYRSEAQVKVFVAKYRSDADLVVYKCPYASDAEDNK